MTYLTPAAVRARVQHVGFQMRAKNTANKYGDNQPFHCYTTQDKILLRVVTLYRSHCAFFFNLPAATSAFKGIKMLESDCATTQFSGSGPGPGEEGEAALL